MKMSSTIYKTYHMPEYITSFYEGWRDLMDNKSDPRTRNWPLMSSPFPTIAISLTYAYFVKVLGPKLMENRKPFQLRKVLIVYNFAQVIFSAWLFYESCIGGWLNGYNIRCEPVDYSPSPAALRVFIQVKRSLTVRQLDFKENSFCNVKLKCL
ncbi:elongation of very long chain fatty acids protein-like [Teleopsis dalmanni]|uniref:elongation of very long chain fatty acids protein-like n=1 Tax=Teleopsis dalmanni TaxID=139649 RepID=UPI0018CD9903|nr:elongation of very long chain fatty acids protein-like [Teleopsis dalmanni]